MYGDSGDRYHMDLRSNTVEYMRRNREDFEPFFDPEYEGVTFERHLDLLEEDGTFAGKFDNVYMYLLCKFNRTRLTGLHTRIQ